MVNINELQQHFFNLIAKIVQGNHEGEIVELILKEIADFTEADFISAYIQFDENVFFRLIRQLPETNEVEPHLFVHEKDKDETKKYFKKVITKTSVQSIRFDVNKNDCLAIVILKEQPISASVLTALKKECKKIFDIIARMKMNEFNNENNKFLLDISTKLMKSNDRQIVLTEIVHSLKQMYPTHLYYIILTQEYDEADDLPIKYMEYADENSKDIVTEVFMTGEMRLTRSEVEDKKVIYAPLLGEQSVYGVLEIIVPEKEIIRAGQMEFTNAFALLAGKALEKTILYENSLVQVNNLTLLHEVIHQLNSSRELTEITGIVRKKIISISHAEEIGFIYHNETEEHDFEVLEGSTDLFYTETGLKIASKLKEIIDDVPDAIFSGNFKSVPLDEYRSLMVFPMLHSGMSPGFIVALSKEKYYFIFESFKLIKTLIQHSSLAMANTILQKQLELSVITDYLTKLYSRKYLEEQAAQHLSNGTSGVLLLFDIDDFKKVNDAYGHHVGDVVLKQVARALMKKVGKKGIPARWGGEELAAYLPEMDLEAGAALADEIRLAISNTTEPKVTISCGVSSWRKGDQTSVEKLFLDADNALYGAKAAGKNQVILDK